MTGDRGRALQDSIADYAAGGYEVAVVAPVTCACGAASFEVLLEDEVGVAACLCVTCGAEQALADSDEHLDDVEAVDEAECRCGAGVFHAATGFALAADGEVRWVSVGLSCDACGLAGVYADWKIDYAPTAHLLPSAPA